MCPSAYMYVRVCPVYARYNIVSLCLSGSDISLILKHPWGLGGAKKALISPPTPFYP